MGSIIGLDIGTVRVGCAVADTDLQVAFPRQAFAKAQGAAESGVSALINELKAELLVVGYPLNSQGLETSTCEIVDRFCRRLQKRVQIEIVLVDEGFSSVEVTEVIGQVDRESGRVDSAAACNILNRFFKGEGIVKRLKPTSSPCNEL